MLCPSLLCRKDCKRFGFGHWADRAPNRSLGGGPAGQAFSTPGWQGIGADTDSASWRLNLQISCATKFRTKFSSISYPQMCKLCFGCFPPTGKEKKQTYNKNWSCSKLQMWFLTPTLSPDPQYRSNPDTDTLIIHHPSLILDHDPFSFIMDKSWHYILDLCSLLFFPIWNII